MTFTPTLLTDLAYFFTNTDRQTLEQAGIIKSGKSGDDKWERFNHNFDIFILKSDDKQLEALANLANAYLGSNTPPPPAHVVGVDANWQSLLAAQNNVIDGLKAENDRLTKMLAGCDWYWPEDDTSSDACSDGPWQIAENCDVQPGEVFGYSRGGVIETRYYGFLAAAEDADSDDQFEADEATREAAEAKIAAEVSRRAALSATEGSVDGR